MKGEGIAALSEDGAATRRWLVALHAGRGASRQDIVFERVWAGRTGNAG